MKAELALHASWLVAAEVNSVCVCLRLMVEEVEEVSWTECQTPPPYLCVQVVSGHLSFVFTEEPRGCEGSLNRSEIRSEVSSGSFVAAVHICVF